MSGEALCFYRELQYFTPLCVRHLIDWLCVLQDKNIVNSPLKGITVGSTVALIVLESMKLNLQTHT